MLFETLVVFAVYSPLTSMSFAVDAAAVRGETPEVVVYSASFTAKFDKNGRVVVNRLYEDSTVEQSDRRGPGRGSKESAEFNTDQIPPQKPPAQYDVAENQALRKNNYNERDNTAEDVDVQQQQQLERGADRTREAWRNTQLGQETKVQGGRVNGPDLRDDRGEKAGFASASSGQRRTKAVRKPDSTSARPAENFSVFFGSKGDRPESNFESDEAPSRRKSQSDVSRTGKENVNIKRSDEASDKPGFGDSQIFNQDNRSYTNGKLGANPERDFTESAINLEPGTETENKQRFDYTKPGNNDQHDASKTKNDMKIDSNGFGVKPANPEGTGSEYKRTHDSDAKKATQNDDDGTKGSRVRGDMEDDDGKIYFQPDLERRKVTDKPNTATTAASVNLGNRNAFDVNVTCGKGTARVAGGPCVPTE